jgi:hypothetical protein
MSDEKDPKQDAEELPDGSGNDNVREDEDSDYASGGDPE